ncbi:unnamed protein product [Prorocentrum cordatum]|uniref:Cathepsin propeptide inhibitor domain-containing protein n=1 Tax=Prorocentrum cordatum TaxID=2364126 RepID=A0ABN9WYE4_9DINO|nr:unnamed protein product [Polarella glacialis]
MAPVGLKAALVALSAPVARALSLEDCGSPSMDFPTYVEKYGRSYQAGTEEYVMRQGVFETRAARIASHNCAPAVLHRAEINHLTDWTTQELATLRGHKMTRRGRSGTGVESTPFFLAKRGKGVHKDVPQDFGWGHLEAIKENSSEQEVRGPDYVLQVHMLYRDGSGAVLCSCCHLLMWRRSL